MRKEEVKRSRGLLVGVYRGGSDLPVCEEHLAELERLADTYDVDAVRSIACPLRKVDVATFLGSGKIEELVQEAKDHAIDLVIFDEEILPSQQRNLEKLFGITVMDRTELILGVFHDHAQSREARLQIELAETRYLFPRLKRLWTHLSRQRGGGSYLKGEGEKQIEIDRRLLQQQIAVIEKEIAEVRQHRQTQRRGRIRSGIPTFAIVGYTNAGKSTLMHALTEADVLIQDKLFATLDTTTRKFVLPNNQEMLLIDTVGFIRKLPHQLVAAFKSTLEEATFADILLHVIDASHPNAIEQAEAAFEVLKEIKADNRPMITVFNKIDQCTNEAVPARLRLLYSKAVSVSALEQTGLDELSRMMTNELAHLRKEVELTVPQSEYNLVAEVMREGEILDQDYEENNVMLKVRIPVEILHKVEAYVRP